MVYPLDEHPPDNICRPGDLIITQTAVGYLLRRIEKPAGPGRWWAYALSTATLEYAKAQARAMAAEQQARALLRVDDNRYELV